MATSIIPAIPLFATPFPVPLHEAVANFTTTATPPTQTTPITNAPIKTTAAGSPVVTPNPLNPVATVTSNPRETAATAPLTTSASASGAATATIAAATPVTAGTAVPAALQPAAAATTAPGSLAALLSATALSAAPDANAIANAIAANAIATANAASAVTQTTTNLGQLLKVVADDAITPVGSIVNVMI